MGFVDGDVANLWRYEFEKHGICFEEIVLIGNNLGELDRPEFIPNVFQLIGIVKKIQCDPEMKVAHERTPKGLPNLMSDEDTKKLRNETQQTWRNSIAEMRSKLQ